MFTTSRCSVARASTACAARLNKFRLPYLSRTITAAAFPVVDSCPSPTCGCRPSPIGLDIDRERPLNGTMAAYAEQVLISTGQSDWPSNIENDHRGGHGLLVKELRRLLGPNGKYGIPGHNVVLTNSSFQPASSSADFASAYLAPTFRYVPKIPLDAAKIEQFVKAFLLPTKLYPPIESLPIPNKASLLRQPELQADFEGVKDVHEFLVLICGHRGRDERCGIMGPLLQKEFRDQLAAQDIHVLPELPEPAVDEQMAKQSRTARVGLISHIGGHKFAGNVIIYVPPSLKDHPLAGKGIWYGRVEPKHVEGIVRETVVNGRVIRDIFRGGIDRSDGLLRL